MAFDWSASVLRPAALVLSRSTAGSSVLTVADRPAAIPAAESLARKRPPTDESQERLPDPYGKFRRKNRRDEHGIAIKGDQKTMDVRIRPAIRCCTEQRLITGNRRRCWRSEAILAIRSTTQAATRSSRGFQAGKNRCPEGTYDFYRTRQRDDPPCDGMAMHRLREN